MSSVVLVTGAAGFVGSHLLESLTRDGSDVTVVAWQRPAGRTPDEIRGARWQAVYLLDRVAVGRAIEDVRPSTVYHCAGAAHVGRSWGHTSATFAANVRGTHHLLEALRAERRPARVLIPGSAMVYRPSNDPLT